MKEIFWKEDVGKFWKYIDVPSLIFVGTNDPLVKYEDSLHPFYNLRYPIWYKLEAPDHLLLETNADLVRDLVSEFSNDPWAFYEKYKHLSPS